jgi:bacterioferritin-associated ferredoxin
MWNLLKDRKNNKECGKLQDLLEESAAELAEATSAEQLSEAWPAAQRNHMAACGSCQEAARDLLAAREIFKGVASTSQMARPWFATRVMAAIAARERELSEAASTWLAVPKFASRLALASGALLLVASTWLYKRPVATPNQQASALAAQESLFEAATPANQDDVLVNMQENKP